MASKNTFKWSHSRQKNFDECKRKFYLQSYAIWGTPENQVGGWDWRADEFTKLCYRLSKLQNIYTWPGLIVHDSIEGILNRIRQGESLKEINNALKDSIVERLRQNWRQSCDDKAWIKSPKWNMRLFETHYGIEVTQDQADDLKGKIFKCLDNFLRSDTFRQIYQVDFKCWKSMEEFQFFHLGSFEACLKMDFALELDKDKVALYDWKTGRPREADADQLKLYSLYAIHKWKYEPKGISVRPFYLQEEEASELSFAAEELEEKQREVAVGCQEIQSHLRDPKKNIAHIDDFPMTADRWKCQRCSFFEACYSSRVIQEVA